VRLKQYGVRLIKFDALNISKKAIVINDHKHAYPASYSFHSLRHGGATLAAKAGVPEVLLKHHRDW
jgi:integrase